jgi:hypothetical protein
MSTIKHLIIACCDDGRVLAHGAALVDGARAVSLRRLARERERFCDDLAREGRTLHHTPRVHGSWVGAIRGALFDARRLATGPNTGDVIFGCRKSQQRVEAVFADAVGRSWPNDLGQVLAAQHQAIAGAREVLIAMQYGEIDSPP